MELKIDLSNFTECFYNKMMTSKSIQPSTVAVHKEILEGTYLQDNLGTLTSLVSKCLESTDEDMAVGEFITKLAFKLPKLECSEGLCLHDVQECKMKAAALLLNIFSSMGMLKKHEEIFTYYDGDGKRHAQQKHFVKSIQVAKKTNLLFGLNDKPGVVNQKFIKTIKVSPQAKKLLKQKGSMKFKVSDICTEELIKKGYSLSLDFNHEENTTMKRINKIDRYANTCDAIMNLKGREFYLSMFFDSRYREYYDFQLEGIRPQGKLWETQMMDTAKGRVISQSGFEHIMHIIYVLRYGRVSVAEAASKFTHEDYEWAKSQDPLDSNLVFDGTRKPAKEFGERILLNKLAGAIDMYNEGRECNYLFGKDLTNSGLIMSGVSFRSEEMAAAGNVYGNDGKVVDSHSVFGDAYGLDLPRDQIKKMHTELLHGSSAYGTVSNLLEHGISVTPEQVRINNRKAYGNCIDNIETIAAWGKAVIDNNVSRLTFHAPDGLLAAHYAYMEATPFELYSACPENEKGYSYCLALCDAPIKYDGEGDLMYGYGYKVKEASSKFGTNPKLRGLFANITHTLDAYVKRCVDAELIAVGSAYLTKHDDYMVHPNDFTLVEDGLLEGFRNLAGCNWYSEALNDIASNLASVKAVEVPDLVMGTWNGNSSPYCNFLMP